MDPRPYNYEYRKPRLHNPTFQSVNLYESLYHRNIKDRYESQNHQSNLPSYNPNLQKCHPYQQSAFKNKQLAQKYASSFKFKKQPYEDNLTNSALIDSLNPQYNHLASVRPNSNKSNQSNDCNQKNQKSSLLASYGRSSMLYQKGENYKQQKNSEINFETNSEQNNKSNLTIYDKLNQFSIFQKQQKPYNIVGNYPRQTSSELRKYPKLTLQNKLIEEGKHYLNSQK